MQKEINPKAVLLISGKRKSGKDYFSNSLMQSNDAFDIVIIKISAPIKMHFARSFNLDFNELMSSGEYKEMFREKMIKWSENMREKNPGIFCEAAIEMCNAHAKSIWVVSDVRRNTDVTWFKEKFTDKVKTIRIEASDDVRSSRGWHFVPGIDDAASECNLDNYQDWDWKFKNDDDLGLKNALEAIFKFLKSLN